MSTWRVAATARHAVYLECVPPPVASEPPVLVVLTRDAVRIPGGLVVDALAAAEPFAGIDAGTAVRVGAEQVELGSLVVSRANPVVVPRPQLADPEAARGRAPALAREVAAAGVPVVPELAGPLARLQEAVTTGDADGLAAAVRGLLGRGPGLTPSGDDVVCGLLVTWSALGDRVGGVAPLRRAAVEVVLAQARALTTAASAALLWQAARGACVPELAALLTALGGPGHLSDAVREVARIGHHSGSDLLRGVQAALVTGPSGQRPARPARATTATSVSFAPRFSSSADSD